MLVRLILCIKNTIDLPLQLRHSHGIDTPPGELGECPATPRRMQQCVGELQGAVLLLCDLNLRIRYTIRAQQDLVVRLHHSCTAPAVKLFLVPSYKVQGRPLDLIEIFQGLPSLLFKLGHNIVQLVHGGCDPSQIVRVRRQAPNLRHEVLHSVAALAVDFGEVLLFPRKLLSERLVPATQQKQILFVFLLRCQLRFSRRQLLFQRVIFTLQFQHHLIQRKNEALQRPLQHTSRPRGGGSQMPQCQPDIPQIRPGLLHKYFFQLRFSRALLP
mmetsp:Transcript_113025/g.258905  ORF Transcript_113025/g.258905 Transcript_113025/m.258905 type:complete len:271 (-) Transcript_113025:998-1810(-)